MEYNNNKYFVLNYRDQNFGLNDLAAIQDVRNEFSLQDINEDTSSTFKEKGK